MMKVIRAIVVVAFLSSTGGAIGMECTVDIHQNLHDSILIVRKSVTLQEGKSTDLSSKEFVRKVGPDQWVPLTEKDLASSLMQDGFIVKVELLKDGVLTNFRLPRKELKVPMELSILARRQAADKAHLSSAVQINDFIDGTGEPLYVKTNCQ